MLFLKKNISFSRLVLMFIFFSLGTFLFTFQQITIAAQTKAVCEGLSLGSSCKPQPPGCDPDITVERPNGYCSDVGIGTSHTCCVKLPILVATDAACTDPSVGGSCAPVGTIDANCSRAGFSLSTTDLLGYCDGATGQRSCCKLKVTATGPGTDNYCTTTLSGECKPGPSPCVAPITELGSCTTSLGVTRKCCSIPAGGACAPQGGSCQSACPTGTGPITASDCGTDKCCKSTTPGVPGASASIAFPNPISGAGNSVEGVVGSISGVLQGIIVVLALVFIVIGAVIYVTSAGNDERMKTAKAAITASMIGLALAIAGPSFLKQIGDVLGWTEVTGALPTGTKTLTALSLSVLQFLLSIVGILGIIMLVIGGLAYLTSAGDEERSQSGKKIITYAIIGIAVALASLILVTQVAKLFV